ncbi:hypothetical protein BCR42DRAFT_420292, partial [Absidia repens]
MWAGFEMIFCSLYQSLYHSLDGSQMKLPFFFSLVFLHCQMRIFSATVLVLYSTCRKTN